MLTVHLFSLTLSIWLTVSLNQKYILLQAEIETDAYSTGLGVVDDSFKNTNNGELQVKHLLFGRLIKD